MASKTTTKELPAENITTLDGGIALDDLIGMEIDPNEVFDATPDTALDDLASMDITTVEQAADMPIGLTTTPEPLADPFPNLTALTTPKVSTGAVHVPATNYSTPAPVQDPFEALISDVGSMPEWMTFVFYGKNGTGKTTVGASGDRTLVLEVEKDGTFSVVIKSAGRAKKRPIKTWADFEMAYWYIKRNPGKFDIVVIDTLTRLQEWCVRDIVLGEKAQDIELMDKDVIRVSLQQRGDVAQKMIYWLNAFNNLPLHKVWLCQEASGDEHEVTNIYPDLQRKIRVYVCSDATVIGRTTIRMKEELTANGVQQVPQWVLLTQPSEEYLAKDRTNMFGKGLIAPTIDKMISKVYAQQAAK